MHQRSLTSCSKAVDVVRRLVRKRCAGGRLAGTLAADDQLDDPAAAGPVLGYEVRSLFSPQ